MDPLFALNQNPTTERRNVSVVEIAGRLMVGTDLRCAIFFDRMGASFDAELADKQNIFRWLPT